MSRTSATSTRYVPNLTIYAARGSSSTVTAYIRGIGQADPLWGVDPGVGIYLDDVYIARPQGALLDVFDVGRIEVLRGPQGTLYGKNTIGGAIKYISRGLPTQTEGFASVTVGNYDQLDAKAAFGGPIGGADSGLRGRVAVASLNRDGFGENRTNRPAGQRQGNQRGTPEPRRLRRRRSRLPVRLRLDGRPVRRARREDAGAQPAGARPIRRWTTATTSAAACPTSTTR